MAGPPPTGSATAARRPDQSWAGRSPLLSPSRRATRPPRCRERSSSCLAGRESLGVGPRLSSRFSPVGPGCPGASARPLTRPALWVVTAALSASPAASSSSSGAGLTPGVREGGQHGELPGPGLHPQHQHGHLERGAPPQHQAERPRLHCGLRGGQTGEFDSAPLTTVTKVSPSLSSRASWSPGGTTSGTPPSAPWSISTLAGISTEFLSTISSGETCRG